MASGLIAKTNITDRPNCGLRCAAMNRIACVMLAVAVAGCGGDESGWQSEVREDAREFFDVLQVVDPDELLRRCFVLDGANGRSRLTQEALESRSENIGSYDPLAETLASHGVALSAATLDEAIQIYIDETDRACP